MPDHSIKTITVKLYPNTGQEVRLATFLAECCRVYNRCLEMRIKAYKRRKESISYNAQSAILTEWRERMPSVRAVPVKFSRSALKRLDRAFSAFFRRCEEGVKRKGFPRFKSRRRYDSMECSNPGTYYRGRAVFVPGIGEISCRGQQVIGKQKLLRIIRKPSGWYAQIVVEGPSNPPLIEPKKSIGIDVGLTAFATLSNGEKIENPRFARNMEQKLKGAQRSVSRKKKGSKNRRKAIHKLAGVHEKIAGQRRDFAHQESRKLVNRFDLIGFEKLNIAGMVHGNLARSIMDAAWGLFLFFVTYKAASAGRHAVPVNPRGTSQECPNCGAVKAKSISERHHQCPCGASIDRDEAAALVIETRALGVAGAIRLRRFPPILPVPRLEASGADETDSPVIAPTQS